MEEKENNTNLVNSATKAAMQIAGVVDQIETCQAPFVQMTHTLQDALQPIQNSVQSYQRMRQNILELSEAAVSISDAVSVAKSKTLNNALLETTTTAVKMFQKPLYENILATLEKVSISSELREFKQQLEISTQAMDSSLIALSAVYDYINTFKSQWNIALSLTDALERSIAAQNLAIVKLLPDYEKLDLPRGSKSVLKSLTKTTAKRLIQSDKIKFDPKERDFYYEGQPYNKLSADQITVVESSLEIFEEFTFDDLVSFESKLEENETFALKHPIGVKIYEILKNWDTFVGFEDIIYYHARALGENQRPYFDSEMLKAPTNVSAHGRYNEVGRSCYYIAESRDGAVNEIKKHSGGTNPTVQVIGLKAVKPVRLLDLSGNAKKTNYFIEHIRFAVENEDGKKVHEYLLPNFVAACCKEIGIDGIRYRSTGYNCCVLWKDDYFEFVKGSRIMISFDTVIK